MRVDIYNTDRKYNIIYADPPWAYNDKMHGHSFSLEHEYETQSLEWIKRLNVGGVSGQGLYSFSLGGISSVA